MRVKTGSHKYLIAIPLLMLLTFALLCFATVIPTAAADDTIYLEADLTVGGEPLPSAVTYAGTAYDFGFRLFYGTNRTYWETVSDAAILDNFEILYYAATDLTTPIAKPQSVGEYVARVVAIDILSGYKNNIDAPRLIAEGVIVGEKRFSIVNEGLSLYCTPIDRVNSLILDDDHVNFYGAVTSGISLLLNGQPLTVGAGNDYTYAVQRHNGSVFANVDSISTVGTYRLKITIKSSVDLSRTSAESALERDGDDYLLYREFTVARATVNLSLTSSAMYEDALSAVTLTDASKTKLASEISVSYNTQVILLSSAESAGRVVASQNNGAVSYTPTAAGDYVYRVTFATANAGYGVAVGDYVDLSFKVKKIPYVLSYRINNSASNLLNFEINGSGTEAISLSPHFADLSGREITSVATQTGQWKFTVSYQRYNTAPPEGWETASPIDAGRYRVLVTFTADAEIESGYTIPSGRVLSREFQIITSGSLNVVPYGGGTCYYTGSAVSPELLFLTSAEVDDVPALVDGKYTLSYFDPSNASVASPIDVGEYFYEVKFTEAVSELGVAANAVYRGVFRIVYHTIAVTFGDEITFESGETGVPIPATYSVSYYEQAGGLNKLLSVAPTVAGSYLKKVTFSAAIPQYNIAAGDFVIEEYSIAGVAARCEISTTSLDLVYDGGVKEPTLTFSKGTSSAISLVEYRDYIVSYFKQDIPCGKPTQAGTYLCMVTFLRSDEEYGLTRGSYTTLSYTIAPRSLVVSYTVSTASRDLVYDATNKTFTPRFTDGGHPVTYANTVEYAVFAATPAYGTAPFKNAGKYYVRTTLADDKEGSLSLDGARMEFTIEKLSLEVQFTVPLSYMAMWTGSEVSPDVKYVALNGRYADETARTAAAFTSLGVSIGQTKSYFTSEDTVHFETPVVTPILTGTYLQKVTTSNENIRFQAASALGNDGSSVTAPTYTESEANQIFSIIPREVEVGVTYDEALYFTGNEAEDRKGVISTSFNKYNSVTGDYDISVGDFASDYKILYYPSDYSGVISGEESETKPTDKGYYVARVMVQKDGANDTYLTEGRYTFKSGKNAVGGDLAGVAVYDGCYVDFIFRISDQNKLDVIYNRPATFAENGEGKAISVTFLNNFSEVLLQEGDGKDYKITYIDSSEHEQAEPFSEKGDYRLKITFLKTNIAYRIDSYSGTYTKSNDLYISENDTILFDFTIFEPRALSVDLVAPASLHYDGNAKNYSALFTVNEDGVDSKVTLTYGTHYKLLYYALSNGKYESIFGAPTVPGDYAVEVAFLTDLLDYTLLIDEAPATIKTATVTTIKDANGVFTDAKTPRVAFTLNKAVLVLSGLKANNKVFDGTDKVAFSGTPTLSTKVQDGVALGAMVKVDGVFPFTLMGEIKGAFASVLPATSVTVNVSANYALPEEANDLYLLEYPSYEAAISKSVVVVTPVDVTREYNPLAVNSIINYSLTYDVDTMSLTFPTRTQENLLIGRMSHEEGSNVGWYKIIKDTLAFNDAEAGLFLTKKLSDLFELQIEEAGYRITERLITVALTEGQSKVYGDADPKNADGEIEYGVTILSGSLIYGDRFVCKMTRAAGENAGTYGVTLSDARIVTKVGGVDVSANYRITLVNGTYEITKRRLKVSPRNQTTKYLVGFDDFDIEVLDLDRNNRDVTEEYVKNPTDDRLSGRLVREATDDPLVFSILQGSVTVVNASGKNVASNYDVDFDTSRTYSVEKEEIVVRVSSDAVYEKVYGDKDPIIAYTITKTELAKLGDLTLADYSSVSRVAGEDVGEYNLYKESTPGAAGGFYVMDDGVDVSQYFTFIVNNVVYGRDKFTILPRPITITVEDETYENTGREILPILKYLNANGSRLSASVLSRLKVKISVPQVEYTDGENLVTPVITGEVQEDPNFEITFKAGTITVVYLQNRVTATALPETDEIYEGRKYLLAGIMLYKTVRFYKLETANGEQPDREVEISLPIDDTIKGEGLVAVALYADAAARAFAFTQSGRTLLYTDDGAYYVAIAEIQEWFYVIWGAVIIAGGVAIYFLVRLIIKIVKKKKSKQSVPTKKVKKAKKPKGVSSFAPNAVTTAANDAPAMQSADPATDDLFSDEAVTAEETPAAPVEEPILPAEGTTDNLFSDETITDAEAMDVAALDFDIPDQNAFAGAAAPLEIEEPKETKKDKKKKEKKQKEEKPDKKSKKQATFAPKGFVPSSFKPKGDKSGVYAPTRSYQDDLFIDEEQQNTEGDMFSDDAILANDNSVVIPSSNGAKTEDKGGDDELIIARSSGLADDEPDDSNGEGDKDLL